MSGPLPPHERQDLLGRLIRIDRALFRACTAYRPARLTNLVEWITGLGDTRAWVVLGVVCMFSGPAGQKLAWIMGLGGILSVASTNILKFAVQRPRPFEAGLDRRLIDEPFGNSFPSGHSTQAMTIVTAVAVVYPNVAAPLYCLGLAIALSRIYLGVHFPFDVLLGVALGTALGPVAVGFANFIAY
ncbi:MAG: phosphatase PAP2 family protein [Myxococcota bacterium]|nr:phosphatase PAP2 family protein [Myxococcota bacterium]